MSEQPKIVFIEDNESFHGIFRQLGNLFAVKIIKILASEPEATVWIENHLLDSDVTHIFMDDNLGTGGEGRKLTEQIRDMFAGRENCPEIIGISSQFQGYADQDIKKNEVPKYFKTNF